jgi:hypothetical protein
MTKRLRLPHLVLSSAAMALFLAGGSPASALTMKECGEKYQAAKTAGTLKGQKWNDFRKVQCGDDDASADDAAAAETATPAATPAAAGATVKAGKVVFPKAVSASYANETAGRARLHTCVDQYRANKAGGGNGDLKWIEKGGGYWSECNKRLKS